MLLKNENSLINQVALKLSFDNNTFKEFVLKKDDIVYISFVKNNKEEYIEGKIINIFTQTKAIIFPGSTNNQDIHIVVDGSEKYSAILEDILVGAILDLSYPGTDNQDVVIDNQQDVDTAESTETVDDTVMNETYNDGEELEV